MARTATAAYAYAANPAERDQRIAQHLPLVHHVLGRLAIGMAAVLDREDLVAHGVVGLIQAIDRYNPALGVPFAAYATMRIRGAILDAIRALDPVSPSARQRVRALEAAVSRLTHTLGRVPTDAEIQAELGVDEAEYAGALEAASWSVVSLDAANDDESSPLADLIQERTAGGDPADRGTWRVLLADALRQLDERERLVLSLYYVEDLTFQEIGRVVGVHKTVAVRLHSRAIVKLRALLGAET